MTVSDLLLVGGYVRCSAAEQAHAGNGLAAQQAAIAAGCTRRGRSLPLA